MPASRHSAGPDRGGKAEKADAGSRLGEARKPARGKAATRVLIVDDHPLFTTVLAELLNEASDFKIIGTAGDVPSALEQIRALAPDLVVLDLMLPGASGLELLQVMQAEGLPAKVVVCSGAPDDEAVEMAFAYGARSFVGKEAPVTELVSVLRKVARGEPSISDRAAGILRETLRRQDVAKRLQGRDLVILRSLAMRQSVKEIAATLGLSIAAVYKARTRIARRFGAPSPADLQAVAAKLGLVAGANPPVTPAAGPAANPPPS